MADSAVVVRIRAPNQFSILMVTPVPLTWNWLGKATLENHCFVTIDLTIPCNWAGEYPPNCEACQWNDPAQCDKVRLMTAHVLIDDTDPENLIKTVVHKYKYELEMQWNQLSTPLKKKIEKVGKSDAEKQDLFDLCISATLRKNQTDILDKVI